MGKPEFAAIDFAPASVNVEPLDNGGMILSSTQELGTCQPNVVAMLRYWADTAPDRLFLAERTGSEGWRELSYGEALTQSKAISQALLDRGISPQHPIVILSDNGIDSAILQLAAMQVGIPVSPVSPAYSLMSQDHAKLKHIFELIQPRLIYVADGLKFQPALEVLDLSSTDIVVSANPCSGIECAEFADLLDTAAGAQVEAAFAQVGPDSVAKILFTSGSTGLPKGVINTQRMLCSNQQAISQIWPFLQKTPPVILDWLPWNHTFGANHNFNMVLFNGGTMYVDNGKPVPGLIENTVQNLREISPTIYFNVPRGFDVLLPFLEQDEQLRDHFFKKLQLIFYAGAALPQNLWERLEALSVASRGVRVPMVSAWGSTETAPMVTSVHFNIERAGVIGLPAPGTFLKMIPNGDKLELRVKGPNVTPGYWKSPELTKAAFDEDGYYEIGDAGKLADPNDPAKGVVFDGRVAEDFKLNTGTWVHAGALRVAAISAGAPVIQDAVVTGHDRGEVGLLVFANPVGCASLASGSDTPLPELVKSSEVLDCLRRGIGSYNEANRASSTRIARVLVMAEPPSIDANEITDKGYINQRAVLEKRAELVERLYQSESSKDEILVF